MQIEVAWTHVQADLAHAIGTMSYADEAGHAIVVDTREIASVESEWHVRGVHNYGAEVLVQLKGHEEPHCVFRVSGLETIEQAKRIALTEATKIARFCGLLGALHEHQGPWPTPEHDTLVREIEEDLARWDQEARDEERLRRDLGGEPS